MGNKRKQIIGSIIFTLAVLFVFVATVGYKQYKENEYFNAALSGDKDILKKLLAEDSVDVNRRMWGTGDTPLYIAASNEQEGAVELLLKAGADPNISVDGQTPLIAAAFKGNIRIVTKLLEYGADVNVKTTRYGYTALHEASRKGHLDVVNLLMANKADSSIRNLSGQTAKDLAIKNGFTTIASVLEHKPSDAP